jgi:hypothetical protein
MGVGSNWPRAPVDPNRRQCIALELTAEVASSRDRDAGIRRRHAHDSAACGNPDRWRPKQPRELFGCAHDEALPLKLCVGSTHHGGAPERRMDIA